MIIRRLNYLKLTLLKGGNNDLLADSHNILEYVEELLLSYIEYTVTCYLVTHQ
jgi:hypothetical protein